MSLPDIVILGIFGKHNELGEGKTILLTDMLDTKYRETGKPIFADYTLPFAKPINHVSEIPDMCYDCYLGLDDASTFFDCRESGANVNETWVLVQLRKFKVNLIYTAQLKGMIEGRLRKISNMIIETELINFPRFHIIWYSKEADIIDEYDNIYGKRIIDMYKTAEIVKRRISYSALQEFKNEFHSKTGFRQITKVEYAFKHNLADTIYILLGFNKRQQIAKLLLPLGYALID